MKIENIHFVEVNSYEFKIEFIYSGAALVTESIPRSATTNDCVSALTTTVNIWESKRANTNYDALVAAYEGKTVNI